MKYVFILYLNRSGSTFLANQLSKRQEVLVCPEAEILVNMLFHDPLNHLNNKDQRKLVTAMKEDRKLKHWDLNLDSGKISSLRKLDLFFHILNRYASGIKPEASIIVFKAVDLMHHIETIINYLTYEKLDIKFISLIRDPRGIFNSQSRTYVENKKDIMNRNPLFTVYQWNFLIDQSYSKAPEKYFHLLKYEDLVRNLVKELDAIYRFAGISKLGPDNNQKGDLMVRIPEDQLSMHSHIEDPPLPENADKWQDDLRNDIQELIRRQANKGLKRMDYPVKSLKVPGWKYDLLWFRCKTDLAMKDLYRFLLKLFIA